MNKLPIQSILVVDDDLTFQSRLASAFRARSLVVGQASSGNAAIAYVTQHHIDAVVLDLKLGDESGLQVLAEIKVIQPAVQVVILTGYGTIGTAVEALKRGALNYLTKPTDADAILAVFTGDLSDNVEAIPTPALEQVEWDHINRVLKEYDGNLTHASRALGLHRRSLQRKLAKIPPKIQ